MKTASLKTWSLMIKALLEFFILTVPPPFLEMVWIKSDMLGMSSSVLLRAESLLETESSTSVHSTKLWVDGDFFPPSVQRVMI